MGLFTKSLLRFSNLTDLRLYFPDNLPLAFLSVLTDLRSLSLKTVQSGINMTGIPPILSLLTSLTLFSGITNHFYELKDCTQLKTLTLSGTPKVSFENLTNLTTLQLDDAPTHTFPGFQKLTNLRNLSLSISRNGDLEVVTVLANLCSISIFGSRRDGFLEPLSKISELKKLKLRDAFDN